MVSSIEQLNTFVNLGQEEVVESKQTHDFLLIVQRDGLSLKDIENQNEEICLAAVEENDEAIIYVPDNFKDEIRLVLNVWR